MIRPFYLKHISILIRAIKPLKAGGLFAFEAVA